MFGLVVEPKVYKAETILLHQTFSWQKITFHIIFFSILSEDAYNLKDNFAKGLYYQRDR